MAKNNVDVNGWTDERLAKLNPDHEWQPNMTRALVQFKQRASRTWNGRKWTWAAAAVAAVASCLLAFQSRRSTVWHALASVKTVKDGQPAPDFTLPDATGSKVRLSSYKGKVVLLNFWATWCHGCKIEIPWFMEFQNKYQNRGLAVVGVALDEDGWKLVKPYMEDKKINYPVVVGNEELAKRYGVESMPMTFLIDRHGKIAASHIGMVDKGWSETEIARLLGK